LPEELDELAVAQAARRLGLLVHTPRQDCSSMTPGPPALLLSYALHNPEALRRAVALLRRAVDEVSD
jgi:DNA-binding transcriptional MocR family regulator